MAPPSRSAGRGVLGAVDVAVGVVHEAVVGALDHDDLAVGAARPRGAEGVDVGGGRPRVGRTEDRERRAILDATSSGSMRWPGPFHASGVRNMP